MKLWITLIAFAPLAMAQYTPSQSNSSIAAAEINGKINWQSAAGAPSALQCTQGKDFYTNTSNNDLYKCTVTGTPGTWALVVAGTGGTVTSVATTGPITGGTFTTSGTIACPTCVTSASALTNGQLVAGGGSQAAAVTNLTGDVTTSGSTATTIAANAVTGSKMANNTVTSTQLAVVNTRRTCTIVIGADNAASGLGTTDIAPQGRQCYVPYAAHVVEIMVAADGGTPAVVVAKNHGGTLTDLSASLITGSAGALDCANPAGSGTGLDGATTCTVALTGSAPVALAAGDWLETHSSAGASTAKRMSIAVTYVVD